MSKTNPNVYIIAGPNGADKTTFAKQFLPLYAKCKNFVNADLIASGLAPFSPESAAIKAGRILLEQVRHLAEQKADFAFESTLSGTAYVSFLKKLKTKGYVIHIFYLWVPKVELSLARIKERVAKGGHNVPAQDVKRRFAKSFDNFIQLYKPYLITGQLLIMLRLNPTLLSEVWVKM
ncbi:MAG: zeta toxin family protein [Candidatus Omnitrophica bacterium]|nr:zeta toxin family protein [Candidatus Omnitrophota bacterium]